MVPPAATLAFGIVFAIASPTSAAAAAQRTYVAHATIAAAAAMATDVDWSLAPVRIGAPVERRGRLLPALYAGLVALNAYDAASTLRAARDGRTHEWNPLMRGAARRPLVMWGVKAGVTTASIIVAERMWRDHNRAGAVAMMIVSNGLMAAVAANNARLASR